MRKVFELAAALIGLIGVTAVSVGILRHCTSNRTGSVIAAVMSLTLITPSVMFFMIRRIPILPKRPIYQGIVVALLTFGLTVVWAIASFLVIIAVSYPAASL